MKKTITRTDQPVISVLMRQTAMGRVINGVEVSVYSGPSGEYFLRGTEIVRALGHSPCWISNKVAENKDKLQGGYIYVNNLQKPHLPYALYIKIGSAQTLLETSKRSPFRDELENFVRSVLNYNKLTTAKERFKRFPEITNGDSSVPEQEELVPSPLRQDIENVPNPRGIVELEDIPEFRVAPSNFPWGVSIISFVLGIVLGLVFRKGV